MTTNELNFKKEHLTFFESMFLNPGIAGVEYLKFPLTVMATDPVFMSRVSPVMRAMGLIESTLWLQLGIEIGFFDTESVLQELVSIEDRLSLAWGTLQEMESLSPQSWCDFMSDGPKPTFMKDKFLGPQAVGTLDNLNDYQSLEHLRQCFLGCLLLTSEVIFEPRTMTFLQSIGWDTDENWEHLIRGDSMSRNSRMEDYDIGFANHVQYLEQLSEYVHSNSILYPKVSKIISQRVIVNRARVKERLFKLGSEILATVYEPGPKWQEVRTSIFWQIARITETQIDQLTRLWPDFVDNTRKEIMRVKRERSFDSFEDSSFAKE
jgi:hypothetical protein